MDRFPAVPAAWYFFGPSRLLRRGPVSKDMLGQRLVAYRTASGRAVVMDARCSHLSADLGCGQVAGENIRCPFHHWEYGPDGACRKIPGERDIPARARQTSYPVEERHGLVFFFHGRAPLFPLPFFDDCRAEDFIAGEPFRFVGDCPWYMLSANGFDGQHFRAVHDRRVTHGPQVDSPAAFARRIRFGAEVVGTSIFDRLLRRFVGRDVEISITCWGGPLILVRGSFPRAESYLIVAAQPLDSCHTLIDVIVFAHRPRGAAGRAFAPLALNVRRAFTRGFLADDFDRLHGIRYNPQGLVPGDQLMQDFFDWIAALPGGSEHRTASGGDAASPCGVQSAGPRRAHNGKPGPPNLKEFPC